MAIQALTPPVNVPWQRLAFSTDMVDRSFSDEGLPPRWRSSVAVFSYVVPYEQTAEDYPDSRIVYLKLSLSLTGLSFSDELREAVTLAAEDGRLGEIERRAWEVIQAEDWASTYFPCHGAVAQLAVYPHVNDPQTDVQGYPFIADFEPKKRELYETVIETGEVLSDSIDSLSVQKSRTGLVSLESVGSHLEQHSHPTGDRAGTLFATSGRQSTVTRGGQRVRVETADSLRELRETTSHTTSVNQLYQLFNGYHLGTNRALFVVLPRPHVVSDASQVDVNLIAGARKLEGVQDVLLVVEVPKALTGICVQANLDTGHSFRDDPRVDDGAATLLVTRRVVRACGVFGAGTRLAATSLVPKRHLWVTDEVPLGVRGAATSLGRLVRKSQKAAAADQLNEFLHRRIAGGMLDGIASGRSPPRPFVATRTFRRAAARALGKLDLELAHLTRGGQLDPELALRLGAAGVKTVGDVFRGGPRLPPGAARELEALRGRVLDRLAPPAPRP